MKLTVGVRRFLLLPPVVTLLALLKYRCFISYRAEIELTNNLKIGKKTRISSFTKIKSAYGPLIIGENVSVATGCFISSDKQGIEIGDHSMIGANSTILGSNYRYDKLEIPVIDQGTISKGVRIGRNVWLGAGVVILDGCQIGNNVIITPNSVVSGNFPDNVILQGNPAKVIFKRR